MIKLFKAEVDAIQAEIDALQAEIAKYEQAEEIIISAVENLKNAIAQVKAIAPSTVNEFKEIALQQFEQSDKSESEDCDGWQDIEPEPVAKHTQFTANFEDKVGYFHDPDGYVGTCYLAGNNKYKLKNWGVHLVRLKLATGFEVREAKRLKNYNHELKVWGIKNLQTLYQINTDRVPLSSEWDAEEFANNSFRGLVDVA